MEALGWLVAFCVDIVGLGQAPPVLLGPHQVARVNRTLHGQVVAFIRTAHGDARMWSPALGERRDLLVYLPPGYDAARRYPLAILLHGAGQDERFFLQAQVHALDRAIASGELPPIILAVPDGSLHGHMGFIQPASFWTNSRAGRFEDFVMTDVWELMHRNFSIRPEREAHALMGISMGGSAAAALAIKHKDRVKVALAFMPLLNLRHVDCHGRYRTPYDPACHGLRERMNPRESLGRRKLVNLRFATLFAPLYGRGDEAVACLAAINPLEMLDRYDVKPGELDLYVGYGDRDEFNVAAQVEGFVAAARRRGIEVTVDREVGGRHDLETGKRLLPRALPWAAARVPGPG